MTTEVPGPTDEEKRAASRARMLKARAARGATPPSEVARKTWETRRRKEAARAIGLTPEQLESGGDRLLAMTQAAVVAHASKTFKTNAGKAARILVTIMEDENARPEVRLVAAKEVLDRSLGKSVQTTMVGSLDSEVITLDRAAILNAARRITAASAQDIEPRDDHPDVA